MQFFLIFRCCFFIYNYYNYFSIRQHCILMKFTLHISQEQVDAFESHPEFLKQSPRWSLFCVFLWVVKNPKKEESAFYLKEPARGRPQDCFGWNSLQYITSAVLLFPTTKILIFSLKYNSFLSKQYDILMKSRVHWVSREVDASESHH